MTINKKYCRECKHYVYREWEMYSENGGIACGSYKVGQQGVCKRFEKKEFENGIKKR